MQTPDSLRKSLASKYPPMNDKNKTQIQADIELLKVDIKECLSKFRERTQLLNVHIVTYANIGNNLWNESVLFSDDISVSITE